MSNTKHGQTPGDGPRDDAVQLIKFGRNSDVLAQESWRLYFETTQRITQALESRLKERSNLVIADYNVLLLLWEASGHTLTMSVIARKLVFSPSRLNYRIKVLEKAGLVLKSECLNDKRAHNVSLTDFGTTAFLKAGRLHRQHIDEVFLQHVNEEELEVLYRVFKRVDSSLPEAEF